MRKVKEVQLGWTPQHQVNVHLAHVSGSGQEPFTIGNWAKPVSSCSPRERHCNRTGLPGVLR
jgi:hypothetical protein